MTADDDDDSLEGFATCRRVAPIQDSRSGALYALVVEQGPDSGREFLVDGQLERARLFLGQADGCDIRLGDPHISRRHACLEVESKGLRFTDLGSTNGSRVNGLAVQEVVLEGGERIQVGSTVMTVQQRDRFRVPLPTETRFGRLLAGSLEMRRLFPLFERLARSDIPLVIEGETGTGKEVLAESIHEASDRSAEPFVVFDCTTVAPSLIESSLFGHERGAFTGAVAAQRGLFEEAHNGTLFLDEIGDLDQSLQAKLLRAIDRGQTRRVGGTQWHQSNVRIVAATRRDLDAEVQAGRFRDDLLFRLAVGRVELPPLRRRKGDIALLTAMFWGDLRGPASGPPSGLLARFEAYSWPGNVRELRNAVARHLVLGELATNVMDKEGDAPPPLAADFLDKIVASDVPYPLGRQQVLAEFERRYLESVLARSGGHVGKAADAAGIGRRYLQVLRGRHRT